MKQKWFTGIFLPALCMAMLLAACENDLKQVQQLSAKENNKPVDSTKGVDLVYSDSARVKSRILTPLMLSYAVKKPYKEMPQGVKLVFYDDKINVNTPKYEADKHVIFTVTSDYAITSNDDKLIELRKNVLVKSIAGDTFTTQQMFYDSTKKILYSNVACELNKVDGTLLDGTGFVSNETFTDYHFTQGKGHITTNGNLEQ